MNAAGRGDRTAAPTHEYSAWCSSQDSFVSSPSMFSSSRKPWRSAVQVGTQSSVAVSSVHWTLSCSASESDVAEEGMVGPAASHSATAASN